LRKYSIAVVPLDGVGKHLIPIGVEALRKTQQIVGGMNLEFTFYDAGFEYFLKTGKRIPNGFQEAMEASDAMFCGSVGQFDLKIPPSDYPEFRVGGALATFFRKGLGNTIGIRPLTLMPGFECPLKGKDRIDVVLLRQTSEGGYNTPGAIIGNDMAYDINIVTRSATETIAHYAFKLAQSRNGRLQDGKKMVTVGVKQGSLACLDFYRKVFLEIAPQYPDVEFQTTQVDALAEHIIKDPNRFDVVVCENMHGDIIGDIGSYLTGGMGVAPTADVGGITPHFRPNHGTFPRAVGKNIANPIAVFMTGAFMLEMLASDYGDGALRTGATLIRRAVEKHLIGGGVRTRDMGGTSTTDEVASALLAAMEDVPV
jgi:isocitrate/isopropylmalate dehydrogenase